MPESVVRWPKRRPVVDHRQPLCAAVGDGVPGAALCVRRHDRHEMREQRAGRIELAAGHHDVVALVLEARLEIGGAFGAELGKGVAEADAFQHLAEQELLLRLVRNRADRGDDADVVLRDLADRGIGRGDDLDDLRDRRVGKLGAAERLRHVERPEAALREGVELLHRPYAGRGRERTSA